MDNIRNYLTKDVRLNGRIYFEGPTVIDGCVEGELTTNSALFIGETAEVNASIKGESIIIAGKVTGDVMANGRIDLRPTAKVLGNLTSPALVIHEGASLKAHCYIGPMSVRMASKLKP